MSAKISTGPLGTRRTEADDQAIGYAYLALYRRFHDPQMLAATQSEFDGIIALPDVCTETCPPGSDQSDPRVVVVRRPLHGPRPSGPSFPASPAASSISTAWTAVGGSPPTILYDPQEHLYSRDASYLQKHEANGEKALLVSRQRMGHGRPSPSSSTRCPKATHLVPRYIEQFRQMASRIKSIQSPDGLWRPGLLDAASYPLPEVSGSAFYVYAMAWGINRGILDRAAYLPAVRKGWAGLVSHIYADGRLGSIQPIGSAPDAYKPQTSYVYGVGAFLMAGSEIRKLSHPSH